jgi:hypothetical protein
MYNNSLPGGCSSKYWQDGPETHNFATYLKQAGYTTAYMGKYLNEYGSVGGVAHIPPG